MNQIEYQDGKGRREMRDIDICFRESELRRTFLDNFLPTFKESLSEIVGDSFNLKIVGSVATNLSTYNSDIDILIEAKSNCTRFQKDTLIVESLKTLQLFEPQTLPYKIDLWFEKEFENRDNKLNSINFNFSEKY